MSKGKTLKPGAMDNLRDTVRRMKAAPKGVRSMPRWMEKALSLVMEIKVHRREKETARRRRQIEKGKLSKWDRPSITGAALTRSNRGV